MLYTILTEIQNTFKRKFFYCNINIEILVYPENNPKKIFLMNIDKSLIVKM